jgi:hypothetical protein
MELRIFPTSGQALDGDASGGWVTRPEKKVRPVSGTRTPTEDVSFSRHPPRPGRRPRPRRIALLAVLLGGLGASAVGRAEGARRDVVLLTLGDQPARDAELLRALKAQLTDLPVAVRAVRIAALPGTPDATGLGEERPDAVVARWWLRERTDGGVDVHLADPRARRMLVRTVAPAEVGRTETIALIVGLAVRALLVGGGIDVQPPRPAPAPRAPPPRALPGVRARSGRPRPPRVALAVAYLWTAVDRHHAFLSGGALEVAGRLPRGWALFGTVALGARFAVTWRRLTLGAALALGLEAIRAVIEPLQLGVAPADPGADVTARLIPEVGLQVRLLARLALRLDLGAEIVLNPRRYTAAVQGEGIDVLLYPWPVQPRARLGLVLELD